MRYSCRDCSSSGLSRCISCFRRSRSDSHPTSRYSKACTSPPVGPVYLRLSKFWLKVFAVSFGMGVVSGIVMPFQFGTNWSRYSRPDRRYRRSADGLRRADGVLPRSGLPRRPAVRAQTCAARGCIFSPRSWSRRARCSRRSGSSSSTAGCRRPPAIPIVDGRFFPDGLDRRHLQSVLSVPLRAHRHRRSIITTAFVVARRGRVPLARAGASAKKARPC